MSLWTKVKFFLLRTSEREQVERAYGLWLVGPRKASAPTFISNMTGIPRDEVFGILYGKKD